MTDTHTDAGPTIQARAMEAVTQLLHGQTEPAKEFAEAHDIEMPREPVRLKASYQEDARYRYPARNKLARRILEYALQKARRDDE